MKQRGTSDTETSNSETGCPKHCKNKVNHCATCKHPPAIESKHHCSHLQPEDRNQVGDQEETASDVIGEREQSCLEDKGCPLGERRREGEIHDCRKSGQDGNYQTGAEELPGTVEQCPGKDEEKRLGHKVSKIKGSFSEQLTSPKYKTSDPELQQETCRKKWGSKTRCREESFDRIIGSNLRPNAPQSRIHYNTEDPEEYRRQVLDQVLGLDTRREKEQVDTHSIQKKSKKHEVQETVHQPQSSTHQGNDQKHHQQKRFSKNTKTINQDISRDHQNFPVDQPHGNISQKETEAGLYPRNDDNEKCKINDQVNRTQAVVQTRQLMHGEVVQQKRQYHHKETSCDSGPLGGNRDVKWRQIHASYGSSSGEPIRREGESQPSGSSVEAGPLRHHQYSFGTRGYYGAGLVRGRRAAGRRFHRPRGFYWYPQQPRFYLDSSSPIRKYRPQRDNLQPLTGELPQQQGNTAADTRDYGEPRRERIECISPSATVSHQRECEREVRKSMHQTEYKPVAIHQTTTPTTSHRQNDKYKEQFPELGSDQTTASESQLAAGRKRKKHHQKLSNTSSGETHPQMGHHDEEQLCEVVAGKTTCKCYTTTTEELHKAIQGDGRVGKTMRHKLSFVETPKRVDLAFDEEQLYRELEDQEEEDYHHRSLHYRGKKTYHRSLVRIYHDPEVVKPRSSKQTASNAGLSIAHKDDPIQAIFHQSHLTNQTETLSCRQGQATSSKQRPEDTSRQVQRGHILKTSYQNRNENETTSNNFSTDCLGPQSRSRGMHVSNDSQEADKSISIRICPRCRQCVETQKSKLKDQQLSTVDRHRNDVGTAENLDYGQSWEKSGKALVGLRLLLSMKAKRIHQEKKGKQDESVKKEEVYRSIKPSQTLDKRPSNDKGSYQKDRKVSITEDKSLQIIGQSNDQIFVGDPKNSLNDTEEESRRAPSTQEDDDQLVCKQDKKDAGIHVEIVLTDDAPLPQTICAKKDEEVLVSEKPVASSQSVQTLKSEIAGSAEHLNVHQEKRPHLAKRTPGMKLYPHGVRKGKNQKKLKYEQGFQKDENEGKCQEIHHEPSEVKDGHPTERNIKGNDERAKEIGKSDLQPRKPKLDSKAKHEIKTKKTASLRTEQQTELQQIKQTSQKREKAEKMFFKEKEEKDETVQDDHPSRETCPEKSDKNEDEQGTSHTLQSRDQNPEKITEIPRIMDSISRLSRQNNSDSSHPEEKHAVPRVEGEELQVKDDSLDKSDGKTSPIKGIKESTTMEYLCEGQYRILEESIGQKSEHHQELISIKSSGREQLPKPGEPSAGGTVGLKRQRLSKKAMKHSKSKQKSQTPAKKPGKSPNLGDRTNEPGRKSNARETTTDLDNEDQRCVSRKEVDQIQEGAKDTGSADTEDTEPLQQSNHEEDDQKQKAVQEISDRSFSSDPMDDDDLNVSESQSENDDEEGGDGKVQKGGKLITLADMIVVELSADLGPCESKDGPVSEVTDRSLDLVHLICDSAEKQLGPITSWAFHRIFANLLNRYDRVVLLKATWPELLILHAAYRSIVVTDGVLLGNTKYIRRKLAKRAGLRPAMDRFLLDLVAPIRNFRPNRTELSYLRGVLFFNAREFPQALSEAPSYRRVGDNWSIQQMVDEFLDFTKVISQVI